MHNMTVYLVMFHNKLKKNNKLCIKIIVLQKK